MNTNKIATGSVNKKLLAALAVLAVAFVVLAAVPAVATDSDADDDASETTYTNGFTSAYLISDADAAKGAEKLLTNGTSDVETESNLYVAFYADAGIKDLVVTYEYTDSNGQIVKEQQTMGWNSTDAGQWKFQTSTKNLTGGFESNPSQDINTISTLRITLVAVSSDGKETTLGTQTLSDGNIYSYQDFELSEAETVPAGVTLNVSSGATLAVNDDLTVAGELVVPYDATVTTANGKNVVLNAGAVLIDRGAVFTAVEETKLAMSGTVTVDDKGKITARTNSRTISSGELELTSGSYTLQGSQAIDVSSGATLDIAAGASIVVKDTKFSVEGTLSVDGTLQIDKDASKAAYNFYQRMSKLTGTVNLNGGSSLILDDGTISLGSGATGTVEYETDTLNVTLTAGDSTVGGELIIAGASNGTTKKDPTAEGAISLTVSKDASLTVADGSALNIKKYLGQPSKYISNNANAGIELTGLNIAGTVTVEAGAVLNVNSKLTVSGKLTVAQADGLVLREGAQLFDDEASTSNIADKSITVAGNPVAVYKVVKENADSKTTYGSYEDAIKAADDAKAKAVIVVQPLKMKWNGSNSSVVTDVVIPETENIVNLWLISFNNNNLKISENVKDGEYATSPIATLTGEVDLSGTLKTLSVAGIALEKVDVIGASGSSATITGSGWATRLAAGSVVVDWNTSDANAYTIDDATGTVTVNASDISGLTISSDEDTDVVFTKNVTATSDVSLKGVNATFQGKVTLNGGDLSIDEESTVTGDLNVVIAKEGSEANVEATVTGTSTVSTTVPKDKSVETSISGTYTSLTIPANASYKITGDLVVSGSIAVNMKGAIYTAKADGATTEGTITLLKGATLTLDADSKTNVIMFTALEDTVIRSGGQDGYTLNQVSGSLELTSGTLNINGTAFKAMTLTEGTFTIGSDAVLEAGESATLTATKDTVMNVDGKLILAGTLAIGDGAVVNLDSGSVTKVLASAKVTVGTTSSAGKIVSNGGVLASIATESATKKIMDDLKAVKLYAVTGVTSEDSNSHVKSIESDVAYAYKDETVTVKAAALDGYKIDNVYAKGEGISNIVATYDAVAGTYSFKMPAVAVTLAANASESSAAAFVLVFEDTGATRAYTSQGIITGTDTEIKAPVNPTESGYTFAGWFTDAACTEKIDFTTTLKYKASVTFYGLMQKNYPVSVSETDNGDVVSSPAAATTGSVIVLTVTPDLGYVVSKLTVDGSAITSKTKGYSLANTGVVTYTFEMPAHEVAVSAEFSKLYTVTLDEVKNIKNGSISDLSASSAVEGATVTFKATPATDSTKTYSVSTISVTSADGKTTYAALNDGVTLNKDGTYGFKMPAANVVITATFEASYTLSVEAADNGVVSAAAAGVTVAEGKDALVGSKTSVTVTVQPTSTSTATYMLKTLKVGSKDVTDQVVDGKYTFEMPARATKVTATFDVAYTVTVEQKGQGDITRDDSALTNVAGRTIDFEVKTDGVALLRTITVTNLDAASNATDRSTVYTIGQTAPSMWKVSGSVYTYTMQSYNAQITFEFTDIQYYAISLVDKTLSEGAAVESVKVYTDSALKNEVTDLTSVAEGLKYIVIGHKDNYDVLNASAAYTHAVTTGTGDSAVTTPAGTAIVLTKIKQTSDEAVYSFSLSVDTTITANYAVHMTKVTLATNTNGTLVAMNGTTAVASGTTVPAGTELTLSASNVKDGYVLTGIAASIGTTEKVGQDYTYTVGMEDVTLTATIVQGYKITYDVPSTVTYEGAPGATAGESVSISIKANDGYKLATFKVAGVDHLKDIVDDVYTFTMPASDVAVVATAEAIEPSGAASAVIASLIYDPQNENAPSVMLIGIGGYVPAGTVTVTVYFIQDGQTASAHVTLTVPEGNTSDRVTIALGDGVSEVSATTVAALASYTGGGLTARTTGLQVFEATLTASTATQE